MVQVSVPPAPEVWGTFPRQHLPLFSRHLTALENFFHWKRSSEVRSLIPMPTTYQQSVSERGTPNPAGHEEGAGAPALPQENGRLLQLTHLFSKLSQLLAVPRSEIPLPFQDKFWDVKDLPFPKSRQEVSISPKFKSRQTAVLWLNTCRKLSLGYLWWYMKLILKWLVIFDQNKRREIPALKGLRETLQPPTIQASKSPKWQFSDVHSSSQSFSCDFHQTWHTVSHSTGKRLDRH